MAASRHSAPPLGPADLLRFGARSVDTSPRLAVEGSPETGNGPYPAIQLADLEPRRRRSAAIALALLLPLLGGFGAGHFYARSYGRGFALLGLGLTTVAIGVLGVPLAWLALPALIALDAVLAARSLP